jgi:DNA-binding HxlR family transcriptional regulator
MLGRTYERENCSAARALDVVGERWSLLILRNAMFAGQTRFSEFQRSLGVAPNILANRLERFVETGLMQPRQHNGDGQYVLTTKGLDLQPVIIALTAWGDRWSAPDGPPVMYQHEGCGGRVQMHPRCETCNAALAPTQISTRPGPGARPGQFD